MEKSPIEGGHTRTNGNSSFILTGTLVVCVCVPDAPSSQRTAAEKSPFEPELEQGADVCSRMPCRFLRVRELAEFVTDMRRGDMYGQVILPVVHEECRAVASEQKIKVSARVPGDGGMTSPRRPAYPTWKGMMVQLRAVVRIGELVLMASARPGNGTKKGTAPRRADTVSAYGDIRGG